MDERNVVVSTIIFNYHQILTRMNSYIYTHMYLGFVSLSENCIVVKRTHVYSTVQEYIVTVL